MQTPRDWHNVTMTVEIMIPTIVGEQPSEEQVKAALKDAVNKGLWYHVSGHRVVHTTTE